MPDRSTQSLSRPARRHDRRGGYDIADIYEARLLAQGMRADDFLTLRSSTDAPPIPDVTPVRFGRGTEASPLPAIAVIEPARPTEPDPEDAAEPTPTES